MSELLLFHHAQGLTEGVVAFADRLRAGGHTVHTPDLYEGRVFSGLEEGVGYAQETGFDVIAQRGATVAEGLPTALAYAGFSLGVMAAQPLAQHRPGALGALLLESCVPPEAFGSPWPAGLPVQIHGMAADPFFAGEGDIDAARALVASTDDAELFVYPGDQHLFADSSLASYDADATALLVERTLAFLDRL